MALSSSRRSYHGTLKCESIFSLACSPWFGNRVFARILKCFLKGLMHLLKDLSKTISKGGRIYTLANDSRSA